MNKSFAIKEVMGALMLSLVLVGAAPTLAGEVTGEGTSLKNEDGTLNGKSICAFSGLNDTYSGDPTIPDEDGFFLTQSFGQLPKFVKDFLRSIGQHPGGSCNPNSSDH